MRGRLAGDGEQVSAAWDKDVPFVLAADSDAVRRHATELGLLPRARRPEAG